MPYVERQNGKIVGYYAAAQSDAAEEFIESDSAEFLAYLNPPPSSADVNAERERRIAAGVFVTVAGAGSIPIQGGEPHERNLSGLAHAATFRLMSGDTATLTQFRDALNADHMLTPQQIIELWQGGAAYVAAVMQASWDIKAMDPIPSDFADDVYWPTA